LWAALFIAVLFLGGAQLVLIGVLGEYVRRIYGEVKRRPLHVVKERLGFLSPVAQIRRAPGLFLFLPAVGHLSGHAFRSFHEHLPGRFLAGRRRPDALSRQGAHLAALGIVRSAPRTPTLLGLSAIVRVCEGGAFVVLAEALMPGAAPKPPPRWRSPSMHSGYRWLPWDWPVTVAVSGRQPTCAV